MKLEQTTAFEMVETFVRKNVPSYIHEIILLKELDDSYSYQCAFSTSTQELPLPTEFASIFFFVDNIHGPGKPRLTYRLEETTMIRSPEDGLGFSEVRPAIGFGQGSSSLRMIVRTLWLFLLTIVMDV